MRCYDQDEPIDLDYSEDDLTEGAVNKMRSDCEKFLSQINTECVGVEKLHLDQIGHDFWLTRNGHGAGFWDRGLGDLGEKLTDIAESFGECHIMVDNDKLEIF